MPEPEHLTVNPGMRHWLHRHWLRHQWIRFLVVGAVNTGFSYLVYALLLFAGLDYRAASLGSIVLGIAASYWTQGRLVFGNMSVAAFLRFLLVWTVIYAAHISTVAVTIRLGWTAYHGGLAAIPVIAILSYVLQKFVVFRSTV